MSRAVTIEVYKLDELSTKVQERIVSRWRANDSFSWAAEWRESLTAFEARAPLKVRDWSVGYHRTYVYFDMDSDDVANLSGVRAWKWLNNNGWAKLAHHPGGCPFTGYCGDEGLLDPIREALRAPLAIVSLREVFMDCLHSWARAYEADLGHWYSEECIREDIAANAYEFMADGTML